MPWTKEQRDAAYRINRAAILARKHELYWSDPEKYRKRAVAFARKNREMLSKKRRTAKFRKQRRSWPSSKLENFKWSWIKHKYGMSRQEYEQMLAAQNGVCAICKQPNKKRDRYGGFETRLHVDHCHATGKTRGLLCHSCNAALGLFKENTDSLKAAIEYLQRT
jgi:hypothetical protein